MDDIIWRSSTLLEKFSPDQNSFLRRKLSHEPTAEELRKFCGEPEDGVLEDPHSNLLTTVGLNRITSLIIGGGGTSLAHATCLVGVSTSTTAATVADTILGADGSGNAQYVVADTSFPTQTNGVISSQSTFTSSLANFAWGDWGLVAATGATNSVTFAATGTSPVLINHKVQSQGTKVSGASWVFQLSLTLS
jgi:hypothetical protein